MKKPVIGYLELSNKGIEQNPCQYFNSNPQIESQFSNKYLILPVFGSHPHPIAYRTQCEQPKHDLKLFDRKSQLLTKYNKLHNFAGY